MSGLKEWLDPRCPDRGMRAWHWFVGPPLIVLLALVIGFGSGYVTGRNSVCQNSCLAQRYQTSLRQTTVPQPGQHVPPPPGSSSLLPQGSITLSLFPAVGDQGPVGSCQAWVATWILSYDYRTFHPQSLKRFSPKFSYEQFGHGSDNGSWLAGDLATVGTVGLPNFRQYPSPPYLPLNWPEPEKDAFGGNLAADAAANRFTVRIEVFNDYPNGGMGVVDFIKKAISEGKPVNIDFSVFNSYLDASPYVILPQPGEKSQGGHANTGVRYSDTIKFPDGEVGGVEVQNQWSKKYKHNGRAWMSYGFIAKYAFGVATVDIVPSSGPASSRGGQGKQLVVTRGKQKPLVQPTYVPPSGATFDAPTSGPTPPGSGNHRGWRVGKTVPYASLINAAGTAYKIWPWGIASAIGTESNFIATAYRNKSPQDFSCGLSQITIPTARGEINFAGWSDSAVCNWLYSPSNIIWLTARMFREFQRSSCEKFVPLYAAWNLGPYLGCGSSQYSYPTNPITIQAVHNFRDWLAYVRTRS